jgi:DNA-directed RNA polymerase sigma subunit (sigma70/sigma32)
MAKREKVVDLRLRHTDWSLQKIGKAVDLSRERVRQILKSENLPTFSVKGQIEN